MAIAGTLPFILIAWYTLLSFCTCRCKYWHLLIPIYIASYISENILKPYFQQPRPPLSCIDSYGMPSTHATLSGVYIIWVIYCYAKGLDVSVEWTIFLSIFAVNNAYSRIYLNYHTEEQVIYGFIWGASFTLLYLLCFPIKSDESEEKRSNDMNLSAYSESSRLVEYNI